MNDKDYIESTEVYEIYLNVLSFYFYFHVDGYIRHIWLIINYLSLRDFALSSLIGYSVIWINSNMFNSLTILD